MGFLCSLFSYNHIYVSIQPEIDHIFDLYLCSQKMVDYDIYIQNGVIFFKITINFFLLLKNIQQ